MIFFVRMQYPLNLVSMTVTTGAGTRGYNYCLELH